MVGLLLLAPGSQAKDVSWARVAELFSGNESMRDAALAARDPSLMAGLDAVLY